MRYLLLLIFLVGCSVKSTEAERDVERYKNLVEQLNKINASTYTAKEIQSELKENTDLLKSVKDMTEKIQKSLEEKPAFVEVDPVDVQKEVEQVFAEESKVAEPEPIVQNSVVLRFHTASDFNCSWCTVWRTRNMPYINCPVETVKEHSSVGRKRRKGYPYFDLIVNGKIAYEWTGSVSHEKMNSVIGKYTTTKVKGPTVKNRPENPSTVPQLKWSIGSARNPWNPTREEVISHLSRDHGYNTNSFSGKNLAELITIHNNIHNTGRR